MYENAIVKLSFPYYFHLVMEIETVCVEKVRPEDGVWLPGVTGTREPPTDVLDVKRSRLEEQHSVLTAEPSFWPRVHLLPRLSIKAHGTFSSICPSWASVLWVPMLAQVASHSLLPFPLEGGAHTALCPGPGCGDGKIMTSALQTAILECDLKTPESTEPAHSSPWSGGQMWSPAMSWEVFQFFMGHFFLPGWAESGPGSQTSLMGSLLAFSFLPPSFSPSFSVFLLIFICIFKFHTFYTKSIPSTFSSTGYYTSPPPTSLCSSDSFTYTSKLFRESSKAMYPVCRTHCCTWRWLLQLGIFKIWNQMKNPLRQRIRLRVLAGKTLN